MLPSNPAILLRPFKSTVAAAAKSYVGSFESASLPSGSTVTMPFTMPGTAGLLVLYFALQNSKTITSVVYDPGGSNVTMTQDVFNNAAHTFGIWSGVIPADSGSKNVVVTSSTSVQFFGAGAHSWIATGLASNLVRTTGAGSSTATVTMSVTATDFMFGGSLNFAGIAAVDWSTSTQAPDAGNPRTVASNIFYGADWTISSTNASFSATPKVANSFYHAYATYR